MSNPPKTVLNVEIGQLNDMPQGSWHLIILTHLLQPVPQAGLPACSFTSPFSSCPFYMWGALQAITMGGSILPLDKLKIYDLRSPILVTFVVELM